MDTDDDEETLIHDGMVMSESALSEDWLDDDVWDTYGWDDGK
ncbi:hypothetical protein HNP86_001919 [Methanococcus maripaludis]|uniref:Uncharacterized protein n=1 Tax=Methanococcus maripaludis TaxID=39152 RepID=A0A7J9NVQ5_METMI|nr:hypothetical protein [Methanococcus maripaludis]MBA2851760.1 hypothetical protein [Methanococcus maripaludis]